MRHQGRLGIPEITVGTHAVTICGTIVKRPVAIAPSQWLQFWSNVNLLGEVQHGIKKGDG